MAEYLEAAAAHLRKAQETLDEAEREAAHEEAAGRTATASLMRHGLTGRHMELAASWTRLAAIERGLLPPEMASVEALAS
jgi:hypothetical protein